MNDYRRFLVKIGAASFAIGAGMETFMCFTGACVHSSLRNSALLTPLTSISAAAFAACRYVTTVGSGAVDPAVAPVVALHDELCRATVPGLPIA